VVFYTGAVLRRSSARPVVLRKEGCFSPAVGAQVRTVTAAWNNPATRDFAITVRTCAPAGP
jgi:hypothetical protein